MDAEHNLTKNKWTQRILQLAGTVYCGPSQMAILIHFSFGFDMDNQEDNLGENELECCGIVFDSRTNFYSHKQTVHVNNVCIGDKKVERAEDGLFHCPYCKKNPRNYASKFGNFHKDCGINQIQLDKALSVIRPNVLDHVDDKHLHQFYVNLDWFRGENVEALGHYQVKVTEYKDELLQFARDCQVQFLDQIQATPMVIKQYLVNSDTTDMGLYRKLQPQTMDRYFALLAPMASWLMWLCYMDSELLCDEKNYAINCFVKTIRSADVNVDEQIESFVNSWCLILMDYDCELCRTNPKASNLIDRLVQCLCVVGKDSSTYLMAPNQITQLCAKLKFIVRAIACFKIHLDHRNGYDYKLVDEKVPNGVSNQVVRIIKSHNGALEILGRIHHCAYMGAEQVRIASIQWIDTDCTKLVLTSNNVRVSLDSLKEATLALNKLLKVKMKQLLLGLQIPSDILQYPKEKLANKTTNFYFASDSDPNHFNILLHHIQSNNIGLFESEEKCKTYQMAYVQLCYCLWSEMFRTGTPRRATECEYQLANSEMKHRNVFFFMERICIMDDYCKQASMNKQGHQRASFLSKETTEIILALIYMVRPVMANIPYINDTYKWLWLLHDLQGNLIKEPYSQFMELNEFPDTFGARIGVRDYRQLIIGFANVHVHNNSELLEAHKRFAEYGSHSLQTQKHNYGVTKMDSEGIHSDDLFMAALYCNHLQQKILGLEGQIMSISIKKKVETRGPVIPNIPVLLNDYYLEEPKEVALNTFYDYAVVEKYLKLIYGYKATFKSRDQCDMLFSVLHPTESQLIISPTGCGKSACFMVPTRHVVDNRKWKCLVIVPYVATCFNHLEECKRRNIESNIWDPFQPDCGNDNSVLFVTPDIVTTKNFREWFASNMFSFHRIILDEAHVIFTESEFRPCVLHMRALKMYQRPVTLMTATCSLTMEQKLVEWFSPIRVLRGSQDQQHNARINFIPLKTEPGKWGVDLMAAAMKQLSKTTTKSIVICSTVDILNEAFEFIKNRISSAIIHAKHTDEHKKNTLNAFIKGDIEVLLGTSCIGTGIHIPNLDTVIHLGLPYSVEDYVQQIGRCGRANVIGNCFLFYDPDFEKQWQAKSPNPNKQMMVAFAGELRICRRTFLSKYFNDKYDRCWIQDNQCDNCSIANKQDPIGHLTTNQVGILPHDPKYQKLDQNDLIQRQNLKRRIDSALCGICMLEGRWKKHKRVDGCEYFTQLCWNCYEKTNHPSCIHQKSLIVEKSSNICYKCYLPFNGPEFHNEDICIFPDVIKPFCYRLYWLKESIENLSKKYAKNWNSFEEYQKWLLYREKDSIYIKAHVVYMDGVTEIQEKMPTAWKEWEEASNITSPRSTQSQVEEVFYVGTQGIKRKCNPQTGTNGSPQSNGSSNGSPQSIGSQYASRSSSPDEMKTPNYKRLQLEPTKMRPITPITPTQILHTQMLQQDSANKRDLYKALQWFQPHGNGGKRCMFCFMINEQYHHEQKKCLELHKRCYKCGHTNHYGSQCTLSIRQGKNQCFLCLLPKQSMQAHFGDGKCKFGYVMKQAILGAIWSERKLVQDMVKAKFKVDATPAKTEEIYRNMMLPQNGSPDTLYKVQILFVKVQQMMEELEA